jgi:hypothetical protein
MSHYRIRQANDRDEESLRNLMEVPMDGAISVSLERPRGYFKGLNIQSQSSIAYVVENTQTQEIIALTGIGQSEVFIGNKVTQMSYLSDLRISKNNQNGRIFYIGFQFILKKLIERNTPAYMVVVRDNKKALQSILSKKMDLDVNREIAEYECPAIYLKKSKTTAIKFKEEYEYRAANMSDIQALQSFITQEGSQKDFFPNYNLHDMLGSEYFKELQVEDYRLILHNGEIKSCGAIWNQTNFKSTRVVKYHQYLKYMRPIYNTAQYIFGGVRLPPEGTTLNYFHIHTPLSYGNNPSWMKLLLNNIYNEYSNSHFDYFMLGFDINDPLLQCLKHFPQKSYGGKIITMEPENRIIQKSDVLTYIDSGRL